MGPDAAELKACFPGLADPALHYLDNAATTQMPEPVLAALDRFERGGRANVAGGVHRLSRAANAAYEGARAAVAAYLKAPAPEEVVFTYGATSAINLLAASFGESLASGDEVVVSVLEHHSNLLPWQRLARRRGVVLKVLPMTPEGRLDLDQLERVVTAKCRLVAFTHCSNVTGAKTDVLRVVAAARTVGARVMLDGAQRAPHGPLDLPALGVDFYAFSGHKMFAPTGVGVLWGRGTLLRDLPPFMVGGQMIRRVTLEDAEFADPPRRFEAGTPPLAGAIGLGAAADWLRGLDWAAISTRLKGLTARVLAGMATMRGVRLLGPDNLERRRGVITFDAAGIDPVELCRMLDRRGVALRAGHHCAQPLMNAFGVPAAARASLALYSTEADVDALLNGVEDVLRRSGSARGAGNGR